MPAIDISETLKRFAGEFDSHLERFLRADAGTPRDLAEAVRYAALAPGKRVRPFLVVRCCELAGGRREDAWAAAVAVECVHAFSLVHDDLPAMDDDDLRRGQPTTHKKFGEAMGILAGDALVVRAFEIIAREYAGSIAGPLVLELARAAGWAGMIGGQADDLAGQRAEPSMELTCSIHARKTGRLFEACCRIGAIIGGQSSANPPSLCEDGPPSIGGQAAPPGRVRDSGTRQVDTTADTAVAHSSRQVASGTRGEGIKGSRDQGIEGNEVTRRGGQTVRRSGEEHEPSPLPLSQGERGTGDHGIEGSMGRGMETLVERMGRFGAKMGEGFQIADDILDVTATARALGKSPGKDAVSNKQTYPRCVGVEESRGAAERAVAEAIKELEAFGPAADDLRALASYVVVRDY